MAFYTEGSQQVRIRLSRTAEDIIQNDMAIFNERRNTFINTIISNFYPDAQSSIGLRLEEYKDKLITVTGSSPASRQLISSLKKAREAELRKFTGSFDKPDTGCTQSPIRLQNELYEYLTDERSGSIEDRYYNSSLSGYLRALIEEYARLPFIRREQIYHQKYYSIISEALSLQCQLLLETSSGRLCHVLPYEVMDDPIGSASYLAGYSYQRDEDKSLKIPCSFKISTLKDIRLEKSKSGYLHPLEVRNLKKALAGKGIQFLVSEDITLKVRLTERGLDSFRHQLNLRPTPTETDHGIYTFHCSREQALFYFFKFGKEVEILEPEELRSTFINMYREALKVYT